MYSIYKTRSGYETRNFKLVEKPEKESMLELHGCIIASCNDPALGYQAICLPTPVKKKKNENLVPKEIKRVKLSTKEFIEVHVSSSNTFDLTLINSFEIPDCSRFTSPPTQKLLFGNQPLILQSFNLHLNVSSTNSTNYHHDALIRAVKGPQTGQRQ